MITFKIPYKISPVDSINTICTAKHWKKRTDYAIIVHNITISALEQQEIPKSCFKKPVVIEIEYPFDGLDIDNHSFFAKCVIDSLKGYLIHNDDRNFVSALTQKFVKDISDIRVCIYEGESYAN